jgi:hypothetical protein
MRLLSHTFEKTRVLVALALLVSAGAPLVQYACGVTGETLTTSTIAVEASGPHTAPCGTVSGGVHDRLCGASSVPSCEGEACTTDTVEPQSVVQSETSSLRIASVLTAEVLPSEESAALRSTAPLRSTPGAGLGAWDAHRMSVRFRTLSFRL